MCAAVAMSLAACSGEKAPDIRTALVERSTVAEVVEAPATVTAKATATISSPATGRVARLTVEDGQQVRAGQALLRISSPQARRQLVEAERADDEAAGAVAAPLPGTDLSVQQADSDAAAARAYAAAERAARAIPDVGARRQALAAIASARAQYTAAQAQARDAIRRFDAGIGSLSAALGSLGEAQRLQTRAAVVRARRAVDALVVRAPIAGTVDLDRSAGVDVGGASGDLGDVLDQLPEGVAGTAGELLRGSGGGFAGDPSGGSSVSGALAVGSPVAGGSVLLRITDVSSLFLVADVDETDILLVEPGTEGDVELDAVPGATYAARVQSVDLQSTQSTRGGVTYVARMSLGPGRTDAGDAAPVPRPGMSAVVDLAVRTATDAVSVPVAAVFRDGPRDAVWVVEGGVARTRAVRLGAEGESAVEVVTGLTEGERVVVSGNDRVRDGQRLDEGGR